MIEVDTPGQRNRNRNILLFPYLREFYKLRWLKLDEVHKGVIPWKCLYCLSCSAYLLWSCCHSKRFSREPAWADGCPTSAGEEWDVCWPASHRRKLWCWHSCTLSATYFKQSLFKTSHVTRRPSLKRLSGIQVQLLSLCMGKHQILQNCSLSLRLNFIFEITNEIGQQLCHKCCFFCSNSVIKSLFIRLNQPVRMRSARHTSQNADCFYSNRDF